MRCVNCKYGEPTTVYDYTLDTTIPIIYCHATEEYIDIGTADNEDLLCDLYDNNGNDDDTA